MRKSGKSFLMIDRSRTIDTKFTSYLENGGRNGSDSNGAVVELKPKLLKGELVIGSAHNVVCYTPLAEGEQGKRGSLFITNYKLTFVMKDTSQEELRERNILLGPYDISLSNVGAVWLTDSSSPVRRQRLMPNRDIPSKVKGLQIVCKNMKMLSFNFADSGRSDGRSIAMSLMHHAFPKRHHLLFAFECKDSHYTKLPADMNMYRRPADWKRELDRCDCPYWRITCINGTSEAFMTGASESLIVPNNVVDHDLTTTSRHFRGGRLGVWVWGRPEGAALLRSGEINTDQAANAEGVYLERIRSLHPQLIAPHVLYLCGNPLTINKNAQSVLPPLKDLDTSYKKIANLCTPATLADFWDQDSNYISVLDSSRWLRYVSNALTFADEAAQKLNENITVVLQEGDGVDYCAVVSSLTQLILDPSTRSISGFQSLIEKEWIAMGHPFCDRLGHLTPLPKDKDSNENSSTTSPVLLLFLDCCYQLQKQFPAAFQFTCTYLVSLWDSAHNQLFDTFLFNNNRERTLAVEKGFVLKPVWDWNQQYTEEFISLFYNPLYAPLPPTRNLVIERLTPCTSVAAVEFWSECFERWLAVLDLPASGDIQYYEHNVHLLKEIHDFKEQIENEKDSPSSEELPVLRRKPVPVVSRFYPFSLSKSGKIPRTAVSNPRNMDALRLSLVDATKLLEQREMLDAFD